MNARLNPDLTPRRGRPITLSQSGTPAARRRSNADRTSGGTTSHGLPGDSSNASVRLGNRHRSGVLPERWQPARISRGKSLGVPFHRSATRSDGYTAASNVGVASARSSSSMMRVSSMRRRRRPPPASDCQSFIGTRKESTAPGRSRRTARSTKSAARSTCAAKPRPACARPAPLSHAPARNTRNRVRKDSRSAGGMRCSRTQGGFPSTTAKPPRAPTSAKWTTNEKGSAPPAASLRCSERSSAARRRSVVAVARASAGSELRSPNRSRPRIVPRMSRRRPATDARSCSIRSSARRRS